MDGKALARIGAIVFVALAIVATAIETTRHDDPAADDAATIARPVVERDPLAAELKRCGGIGEVGGRDPSCLRTWAENRRRFLGQPATPSASVAPTTLFPGAANAVDPAAPAPQPEAAPAATPSQSGER